MPDSNVTGTFDKLEMRPKVVDFKNEDLPTAFDLIPTPDGQDTLDVTTRIMRMVSQAAPIS